MQSANRDDVFAFIRGRCLRAAGTPTTPRGVPAATAVAAGGCPAPAEIGWTATVGEGEFAEPSSPSCPSGQGRTPCGQWTDNHCFAALRIERISLASSAALMTVNQVNFVDGAGALSGGEVDDVTDGLVDRWRRDPLSQW